MAKHTMPEPNNFSVRRYLADKYNERPQVPLKEICDSILNISFSTAQRKARLHELPFPTFRLGLSQKSPWLVSLDDLAVFINKQTSTARKDWKRMQL
jgi:hypothetical protein